MRLANKISLILLTVLAAFFSFVAAAGLYEEKQTLRGMLLDRGELIASAVSIYCIETLLTEDYPVLNSFLEETARENTEIISIEIFSKGDPVTSYMTDQDPAGSLLFEAAVKLRQEGGKGDAVLGSVRLRLSDRKNREIIGERLRAMVLSGIIGYLILFITLNIVFRKMVVEKIVLLGRRARRIGEGDLLSRIELHTGDELGVLAGDLNEMSEKLYRYEQELIRARHGAEAANRLKGEFIANMSHEIRTPLNSVIGYSSLLETLVSDEKQRGYIDAVKASGKGLAKLVDDILDISRIEADKLEIVCEPVVLGEFFRELEKMFSLKAAESGIDFTVSIDAGLPTQPILDERRLRQVMVNLIGNSFKFTETGHIRVTVGQKDRNNRKTMMDLLISVEDTGIGITPELREEVFAPFSQGDSRMTREHGGVGLGLAISKKLVGMMNGEIALASGRKEGTVVTVWLKDVPISRQALTLDEKLLMKSCVFMSGL